MPLLGTIGESSARAYGLYNRRFIALTISANTNNYDVYTNRGPTYVPGSSDIVVTVNPGVTVGSTTVPAYAMLVPSAFNPSDTITIINNGVIQGRGGVGGSAQNLTPTSGPLLPGPAGSAGGSALYVNRPTVVTNNGTIAAGGGGGGAGGSKQYSYNPMVTYRAGGGGGGGGAGTSGGTGGSGATTPVTPTTYGGTGSSGTSPAGGGGGAGGLGGPGYLVGGAGGTGGGRGATGSTGGTTQTLINGSPGPNANAPGGSGGAAGSYIVGNPFVTWPVTGTRQGNVS